MTMISDKVRDLIKQQRKEKGITVREMAENLHMDERTYTRIENGEKKIMDMDTVQSIARFLEMDIWDILARADNNITNTNNDTSVSYGGIAASVFNEAVTINTAALDELKANYDLVIAELKGVIAEKTSLIEALQGLVKK